MRILDMPEFKDKSKVLTFEKNTPICEAIDAMAQKNYGAVLVTENEKLTGIFTERDLLRKVGAGRLDLEKTKLADVMTTELKVARTDDQVADCLRRMSQGRFRHMPVVDDKGDLKGMLSQGDFVAYTMSDAIYRAGLSAKADIDAGNSTPFSMIIAILIYTLVILFTAAGIGFWMGH